MKKAGTDIPKMRPISEAWVLENTLEHQTIEGSMLYSPQYSDHEFVYRHITVPRKIIRKAKELLVSYGRKNNDGPSYHGLQVSARRANEPLLPYEDVVTQLYIHMSSDWMLYLIHERDCTLCFRRPRRDGH
ncbi:cyclin-dependent kinase regulatory subunit [Gregarina niphandrodes]|uniref:Cyclin-dependent kinases regulatory subunit n=1 Tax=Gregarina niphandrodes TaxID=110365 RepID=A0A023B9E5_GRENI|nr:cyclin-dependent kinase regulatory subunit [Gregarina niphandrodes]EZG72948.1 cyclin-dependent kinase regulatory subunit [Gregarina niphandrodes]|eukprot:XP_011129707.1 cyclin-dependent kinase regulatory subunit [Gregarina niphandrodes]